MRRRKRKPAECVGPDGVVRPSPYFNGEFMQCCLCDREERADPDRESNWRMLEADGEAFYFCPRHFPPDGASVEDYRIAYDACMQRIIEIREARHDSRVKDKYLEGLSRTWRPILDEAWAALVRRGCSPDDCARHLRSGVLSDRVLGRALREMPMDKRFQSLTPAVIRQTLNDFIRSKLHGAR